MLSAFARAFRTPDLRRKLLFTIAIMAIFRVGSFIPTPGVDYPNVQQCIAETADGNDLLSLVNLFSGGALLQLSIFALGIMPYITASIIVQLLRVVIPRFEALHKEGQSGQAKLTQYTRYLTIALAILQSTTVITTARNGLLFQGCSVDVIPDASFVTMALMVITMTAGTGLIMWLGELITERGVGNGMSLLLFSSLAARVPRARAGTAVSAGAPRGLPRARVVGAAHRVGVGPGCVRALRGPGARAAAARPTRAPRRRAPGERRATRPWGASTACSRGRSCWASRRTRRSCGPCSRTTTSVRAGSTPA